MAKSVHAVAATMASLRVPVTINPIPGAFRTRRREYLAHQFFNPFVQNIEEVPTSARSLRQWVRRQEVAAGRFAGRIQIPMCTVLEYTTRLPNVFPPRVVAPKTSCTTTANVVTYLWILRLH